MREAEICFVGQNGHGKRISTMQQENFSVDCVYFEHSGCGEFSRTKFRIFNQAILTIIICGENLTRKNPKSN
jgi:hypothetical protein